MEAIVFAIASCLMAVVSLMPLLVFMLKNKQHTHTHTKAGKAIPTCWTKTTKTLMNEPN